jgi:hypothetical protein
MVKFLKNYTTAICLFAGLLTNAQKMDFSFERLFADHGDMFDSIIERKQDYRLQLLYTRIDRDEHNVPHFKTYTFDADQYYYYCASMVKLPACALALERINDLSVYKVSMFDSLGIDTIMCPEMSPRGMMLGTPYSCMAQYIKEMLMLSNNRAFNPVYDFLGQYYFQERLHELGLHSAVISNRFAYCDSDQNRVCNPVSLYDRKTQAPKYRQPCINNERKQFYEGPFSPQVGTGYLADRGGLLVSQPKDFRNANYISLSDLHHFIIRLMFPESQQPSERLRLTAADYQYLHKGMGMFPRESAYPALDTTKYPDHYMKYFMGLDTIVHTMPSHLRIFNKVGQAYGFMTDCSYVSDTLNKVEFFLSCSMYLNADGILNDGVYEYDQTGYPFFHNLYNVIYAEEKARPKKYLPKLQWPDFSDTLLVPVRKMVWPNVDTTASMLEIEAVLCSLADSMQTGAHSLPQNAADVFAVNMEKAMRQRTSVPYPFEQLQKKGISVITSDDGHLRVYAWQGDTVNHVYLQLEEGNKTILKKITDFKDNDNIPSLEYSHIIHLRSISGTLYLVFGTAIAKADRAEYLQAYLYDKGKFDKAKVFVIDRKGYTDLLIEKPTGKVLPTYDEHQKVISIPLIKKAGKTTKKQILKLKYDGKIFK